MGPKRVLVGMSGGVDSSYAAAVLKEKGYDVVGAMLNLWTEPSQEEENRCCSLDSQYLARRVAAQLDIPFYVIDAKEEFRDLIVEQFIQDYVKGETPNPCVACNAKVRWKILLEQARKLGIEYIATGHYARIIPSAVGGLQLFKGVDENKDQSYVLSMLRREYLEHTIFPLGDLLKEQVRERSKTMALPSSNQPDSQDLCFVGKMDYREFLKKYAGDCIIPGEIVDENGKTLGIHQGLPFYTIGQRKGLRIAKKEPYFILSKNIYENKLIVSATFSQRNTSFTVKSMNWLSNEIIEDTIDCTVKVRYRSNEIPVAIHLNDHNNVEVMIKSSKRLDITPGQIAVFYQKELCMGGGIIV